MNKVRPRAETCNGAREPSRWQSLVFTRTESLRTTWTFRFLFVTLVAILLAATRSSWERAIGSSLVCRQDMAPSDALLLDNLDPDYLVFERATGLYHANVARRAFVPMPAKSVAEPRTPNTISAGLADLMARVAHLPAFEVIPVVETEPITLNVARQVRARLLQEGVKTVTVVSPSLRSQRTMMIYSKAFAPEIAVRCVAVFGLTKAENWTRQWHGLQQVGLQFLKLQYYRFWVLW
jgi:hypothetical protein